MTVEATKRKEQLREAVLCFLADRPADKFSVEEITRRIRRDNSVDGEFDESHVNDALALLTGYGLASRIPRPLSGLYDYQVSAEGVIFRERNYGQ
jgi:hypothetical protein